MSATDNWMPLYLGDYLGDTMHLSGKHHGAYLLLLMYYWRNGPLPDDDKQLANIAKTDPKPWREMASVIRAFFTIHSDGKLHQKRMDKERLKWADLSGKRSEAGKAGAQAKWHGNPPDKPGGKRMANAMANGMATAEQVPSVCHDFANAPLPLPVPSKKDSSFEEEGKSRARPSLREAGPEIGSGIGNQEVENVVVSMAKGLKMRAYGPGQRPRLDVQEQLAALAKPCRQSKPIDAETLALIRAQAKKTA